MADRSKFDEMLELLINEDKEAAEALFHEIVVEKSRDIYESLLEDEEVEEDDEVDEATDEEVDESEEETYESAKSAGETMREYVEKVSATMGDNGDNTKSTVAGANNMGGTTANIAKGGESNTGGTAGGLANPATSEESAGNVNVPGGKASKSMKAQPKGHGAEKKGSGDNGANTKSTIGS